MMITTTIRANPGELVVRCGEWDTQTEGEPLDHQVTLLSKFFGSSGDYFIKIFGSSGNSFIKIFGLSDYSLIKWLVHQVTLLSKFLDHQVTL